MVAGRDSERLQYDRPADHQTHGGSGGGGADTGRRDADDEKEMHRMRERVPMSERGDAIINGKAM